MDAMSLDAFIYPGWGNPPRLIGDLDQAGNTDLGTQLLDCVLLSSYLLMHNCLRFHEE